MTYRAVALFSTLLGSCICVAVPQGTLPIPKLLFLAIFTNFSVVFGHAFT